MKSPKTYDLPCEPLGTRKVTFDITGAIGIAATNTIIENWKSVWSVAVPMLNQLLVDYRQGTTVAKLLEHAENTLNVIFMPSECNDPEDMKFRFTLFIDVRFIDEKFEHGSIVFAVEFRDLDAEFASATF